MHTEKNIAEAIFGTFFRIEGKSKDNIMARVDQEELCDRLLQNMKEPKGKGNWTKRKAWFNLGRPAMKEIILWVKMQLVPRWVCSKSKEGSESSKIENIWSKKS